MKAKRLLLNSAVGLAVCCSLASAIAQETQNTSDTPVAKPAQIRGSSPPEPASERIARLSIPKGSLAEAVQAVEAHLPKGEEPMNVIFMGDAEAQPVPALTLRNVNGLDALMLVAAAANVQAEPIRSVADGRYIGFRLSQRQRPSRQESMMMPGNVFEPAADGGGAVAPSGLPGLPGMAARIVASGTAPGGAGAVGSSGAPTVRSSRYGGYGGGGMGPGAAGGGPPVGSSGAFRPPSSYGVAGSAGPGGVRTPFDSLADDQRTFPVGPGRVPNVRTHVYPLAEITPFVQLNEIEVTLHDLLKTGGASADDAKLAFHEKTGVLVARGPEEVQELIQELLRALARNSADKRDPDREWARMEVKLDSLIRQLAHTEQEMLGLEKRAEEAEALVQALVRKYESDIRQLKESQSNP